MANASYVESQLGGMPADLKNGITEVFRYVLKNLRIGRPGEATTTQPTASENLQAGFYTATTASIANTEFSIPHSLGKAPYLVVPVLPLDVVGAKLVPLTVTTAADASRVYLSSSVTSAVVYLLIEG